MFFVNAPATTDIYTLSLHDALPICTDRCELSAVSILVKGARARMQSWPSSHITILWVQRRSIFTRSEEHTSELQSLRHLVCRLLLEKKNTAGTGSSIDDQTSGRVRI